MKKTRHDYTTEEEDWIKCSVLPPHHDLAAKASLTQQFNNKFGTNISVDAFYVKAAVLKGKWKSKAQLLQLKKQGKSPRLYEKKHTYKPEQIAWLIELTPENLTKMSKRKQGQLAKKFNITFGAHVSPSGLFKKAERIQKEQRQKQLPVSAKKSDGGRLLISGVHGPGIPLSDIFNSDRPIKYDAPDLFKRGLKHLQHQAQVQKNMENMAKDKFKVLVKGNAVWSGDKKPVVECIPFFILMVDGQICRTSKDNIPFEIVQKA